MPRKTKNQSLTVEEFMELIKDVPGADFLMEEIATGKTPEDIIKEAISTNILLKDKLLKELTPEQLIASFFFWDMIYQRMLRSTLATTFIWNMLLNSFMRFLDVYSSIYAVASESKEQETRAKLMEEFMKFMKRMERRMIKMAREMSPGLMLLQQMGGGVKNERERGEED